MTDSMPTCNVTPGGRRLGEPASLPVSDPSMVTCDLANICGTAGTGGRAEMALFVLRSTAIAVRLDLMDETDGLLLLTVDVTEDGREGEEHIGDVGDVAPVGETGPVPIPLRRLRADVTDAARNDIVEGFFLSPAEPVDNTACVRVEVTDGVRPDILAAS